MRACNYSSDESEVSDESVNSRSCFRVSVCLRRYYQDHRSRCYMLVPRRRRVRWLERRIKKVFSISHEFYLSSDGHMLPSSEPLSLLAAGDAIQVIPLKEENTDNMRNGHTKTQIIYHITLPVEATNSMQEGCEACEQQTSGELPQTHYSYTYNTSDINNSPPSMETEPPQTFSSLHHDAEVTKPNMSDEADGTLQTLQLMKQQALMLLQDESEPKRRVRRRVRRRKCTSPPSPCPLLPPPASSPVSLSPVPVTHIRFPVSPPSPLPGTSSPSLDVERNESVNSRPPRVIRPLAAD